MLAICVARSISLGTKLPDESLRLEWRMGLLSGPWAKRVILRASWLKFFPPQLNWPKERRLVKYDTICNTTCVSPFSFPRYSSRGILSIRPLPSSLLQIADKKVQLGSPLRRISHALWWKDMVKIIWRFDLWYSEILTRLYQRKTLGWSPIYGVEYLSLVANFCLFTLWSYLGHDDMQIWGLGYLNWISLFNGRTTQIWYAVLIWLNLLFRS